MGKKNRLVKIMITLLVTMALILGMLPAAFAEELIESLPTPSPTPTTTVEEDTAEDSKPDTAAAETTTQGSTQQATPSQSTEPAPAAAPSVAADGGDGALTSTFGMPSTYMYNPNADDAYDDQLINTVSPKGTTINVFDYWLTPNQTDPDNTDDPEYKNTMINANHAFKFGATNNERGTENMNKYHNETSSSFYYGKAVTGIVESQLGADGYPVLTSNKGLGSDESSLNYLFDPSVTHDGKASYPNAGGLLKIDDGYYTYDCTQNFASLVPGEENIFKVYDQSAVGGQFFPFNGPSQVLNQEISSTNSRINHYFGMTMSTRFIQQDGGYVDSNKEKPVTYEFSGDDDVWIFIDGVLVGDLGGIHDTASITINFATGDIEIKEGREVYNQDGHNWQGPEVRQSPKTLKEAFGNAWKYSDATTFPDDTYHTLDFFYLERGNGESNMKLKYNLVTIPESDIIKIDQLGNPVEGAEFKLYEADKNSDGTYTKKRNDPICTVTTDANGEAILINDKNELVSLNELYNQSIRYMILEETEGKVPEGYRSSRSMKLYFDTGATENDVVLLSDNAWDTGAYASAKVTTTQPKTGVKYYEHGNTGATVKLSEADIKNGTMFAVVMKRTNMENGVEDQKSWAPVSGDAVNGWKVHNDTNQDILARVIDAAKENTYTFKVTANGAYEVEVPNMPGDIKKYYYMLEENNLEENNKDMAEYTVGYYYTIGTLEGANINNTFRLVSDGDEDTKFDRVFSVDLYIPNIANNLLVQKVDQNGQPVNGATFGLYTDAQCETSYKVDEEPYTVTTKNLSKNDGDPLNLNGAGLFEKLPIGIYYLKETQAPDGYQINDQITEIRVDNTGVYADAGTENDGIVVQKGVGSIVKSMVQFAVDDPIDVTLHDIQAVKVTGTLDNDSFKWNPPDFDGNSDKLDLSYSKENSILEYGAKTENGPISVSTDTGWMRLAIRQGENTANQNANWTDLGDRDLTNLFSGSTIVQVTNNKIDELTISKTVAGAYGDKTKDFTFNIEVKDSAGAGINTGNTLYNYTISNSDGMKLKTGTATITDGKLTLADNQSITLKHNQKIVIEGLTVGWKITVTESDNEGYSVTYITDDNQDTSQNGSEATDTIDDKGNTIAFTNTKDEVPPTGQSLDNPGMWAVLTAGVVLAMVLVALGVWRHKRTQN